MRCSCPSIENKNEKSFFLSLSQNYYCFVQLLETYMLSWPPAMTIFESPLRIAWKPSEIDLSPDPQSILIPYDGTLMGSPALRVAWRAGFWPEAAGKACPKITSSISEGAKFARLTTSLITTAPSSCADTLLKDPWKLPEILIKKNIER